MLSYEAEFCLCMFKFQAQLTETCHSIGVRIWTLANVAGARSHLDLLVCIRKWNLCPWRHSKAVWALSWAACFRWPCLSRRVGRGDFQESLLTSTILWSGRGEVGHGGISMQSLMSVQLVWGLGLPCWIG